ncbi:MAG: cysteine desulfurase-like protein [Verrucomicrobiota bacterium]|nr:cysteine desulfurase-like protein [Verrucomicrobiota bacterium]
MAMQFTPEHVTACRAQFPALAREVNGQPAIYLDGPAGSQVPQGVIEAMGDYLAHRNANHGGEFTTSRESDTALDSAHVALADFVGTDDPDCIAFGANMTSLTFALSRALARDWSAADEVVVTHLDHDANFSPWQLAAVDAGATVREVNLYTDDCTLDLNHLGEQLSERTRLVAVCAASNFAGSATPVKEICAMAHEAGALVFIDAVHYAPHRLIDVADWECDFLACSAYKFFGPHIGVLYGKRALLESIQPYKLRPAPDDLPDRWMTGTQSHEAIMGAKAAVDYLAAMSNAANRREALRDSMAAIEVYENNLMRQLLDGVNAFPTYTLYGITDTGRLAERVPTLSLNHAQLSPRELAHRLDERGIFAWHGNYYAQPVTEALNLEPEGAVRVGLLHYNTAEEVDRLAQALSELS